MQFLDFFFLCRTSANIKRICITAMQSFKNSLCVPKPTITKYYHNTCISSDIVVTLLLSLVKPSFFLIVSLFGCYNFRLPDK